VKAVVVIEWDLDEETGDPQEWHQRIQTIMDHMPEEGLRPVSCGLAIKDKAEAIMAAFHGEQVPTTEQYLETLRKRGVVRG
jgi:hypothetical protein